MANILDFPTYPIGVDVQVHSHPLLAAINAVFDDRYPYGVSAHKGRPFVEVASLIDACGATGMGLNGPVGSRRIGSDKSGTRYRAPERTYEIQAYVQ